MIMCCLGCPARSYKCHKWGECIHYMTEKTLLEQRKEQKLAALAGEYGPYDSWQVNPKYRYTVRWNKRRTER